MLGAKKNLTSHKKNLTSLQKGSIVKNYLYTAREVIEFFDTKLNFKMSEANFAKHKKAQIFKTYKKEGKKGDFYKLPESAIDFFDNVIQRNEKGFKAEERLQAYLKEYQAKEELENRISKQWDKLENPIELTFEMFDIKDLWISAAVNLQELKDREAKGESIEEKETILLEAAKTKEDHIREFKREIFAQNEANINLRGFVEALFEDLEKIYPSFGENRIQLYILKSANDWIGTPENVAEWFAVDLIKSQKS